LGFYFIALRWIRVFFQRKSQADTVPPGSAALPGSVWRLQIGLFSRSSAWPWGDGLLCSSALFLPQILCCSQSRNCDFHPRGVSSSPSPAPPSVPKHPKPTSAGSSGGMRSPPSNYSLNLSALTIAGSGICHSIRMGTSNRHREPSTFQCFTSTRVSHALSPSS